MLNREIPKDKQEAFEEVVVKHVSFAAEVDVPLQTEADLPRADIAQTVSAGMVEVSAESDEETDSDETVDLSRQDYSHQLIRFNLRGANLYKTKFQSANMMYQDLSYADACSADLSGAMMLDAQLKYAYLCNANLMQADLRSAKMKGADCYKANLARANLAAANLKNAYFRFADLSGANLIKANLENADLRNAKLIGAGLRNADLKNAKLDGTQYFPSMLTQNSFKQLMAFYSSEYIFKYDNENIVNPSLHFLRPHMCSDLISKTQAIENPLLARDILLAARNNPVFAEHRNKRHARFIGFFTRKPVLTASQILIDAEIQRLNMIIPAWQNIEMQEMVNIPEPEVQADYNADDIDTYMRQFVGM